MRSRREREDAKKLAKLKVATIADFAGLDGSKHTPRIWKFSERAST
jgi:hypothetical protein